MKYLLPLILSSLSLTAFASELDENLNHLDSKMVFAHSEGERYQRLADETTDFEEKGLYLNQSIEFFKLEGKLGIERNLYNFISLCESELKSDSWSDWDDDNEISVFEQKHPILNNFIK
ncbi:MAG: hypothetical protein S4CHLAM45_02710 [Chlamydiales bacterium]|nr:hypothetical protein [Chlamydiales bacterium]MCH9619129.1 hypothetical protein [Chlamydiales bacterium]MCH9622391.1 hypothetical protein [Chlamydiales bacterium]